MKKFLVICLSVVMLFSTLMLCGFTKPIIENADDLVGTDINVGDSVQNVYLNTFIGAEYYFTYFESLNFSSSQTVTFIGFEDSSKNITLRKGANDTYSLVFSNMYIHFTFVDGVFYQSLSDNGYVISVNSNVTSIFDKSSNFDILFSSENFKLPTDNILVGSALPLESSVITGYYLNTFLTPEKVVSNLELLPINNDTLYSPGFVNFSFEGISIYFGYVVHKDIWGKFKISIVLDMAGEVSTADIFLFDNALNSYKWVYSSLLDDYNPFFLPIPVDYVLTTYNNFPVPVIYYEYNNLLSNVFSSNVFEMKEVTFVSNFLEIIKSVFIVYPIYLATGIVSMFSALLWTGAELTVLGYALLTLLGICLVGSIFYTVFRIFKGKIKKRL